MSDKDETPLEFSALDLMPAWAQESTKPSKPKTYKERPDHEGDRGNRGGGKGRGRDDRSFRGRQDQGNRGGGNRNFDRNDRGGHGGGGGDRRGGGPRGGRDDRRGGGRNDRRGGRDDRRGGGGGRFDRDRNPVESLPEYVAASLEPTEAAAKALARHIIDTVRTFPLVDLAKMVLSQRERYQVRFKSTDPDKDLYKCKSDGSAWLTREEAIAHALKSHALEAYYRVEDIDAEPPKGNFSVVAVCGMSGKILGPPNHHEYQRNIARLHAERFSNMSLENFKSRINMANDEETIEKWKTQVSRKRQYRLKSDDDEAVSEENPADESAEAIPAEDADTPDTSGAEAAPAEDANAEIESEETATPVEEAPVEETPVEEAEAEATEEEVSDFSTEEGEEAADEGEEADAEPETAPVVEETKSEGIILGSEEELNRHFRENFADQEIEAAKELVVNGNIPARDLSRGLLEHLKRESEKLRRGFPLPMIQALCKAFEKEHLKFFKRGKKALHVSPVRPKALPEEDKLTDRVQKIVDFISEKSRPLVVDMLDSLVDDFTKPDSKEKEKDIKLTEKAKEVLSDLRWLTGEGFVLEFPNTRLELGRKPAVPSKDTPPPKKKTATDAAKKSPKKKAASPKAESKAETTEEAPAAEEKEAPASTDSQVDQEAVPTEEKTPEVANPPAKEAVEEKPEEVAAQEAEAEETSPEESSDEKKTDAGGES